jgi:hypothetical protein
VLALSTYAFAIATRSFHMVSLKSSLEFLPRLPALPALLPLLASGLVVDVSEALCELTLLDLLVPSLGLGASDVLDLLVCTTSCSVDPLVALNDAANKSQSTDATTLPSSSSYTELSGAGGASCGSSGDDTVNCASFVLGGATNCTLVSDSSPAAAVSSPDGDGTWLPTEELVSGTLLPLFRLTRSGVVIHIVITSSNAMRRSKARDGTIFFSRAKNQNVLDDLFSLAILLASAQPGSKCTKRFVLNIGQYW